MGFVILIAAVLIANYVLSYFGQKDLKRHGIDVHILSVHAYITYNGRAVPSEVRIAHIGRVIVGGIGLFILFFTL